MRGLHHQGTKSESADNAIAAWEVARFDLSLWWKLRNQGSLLRDSVGKVVLTGRIDPVQSGPGNCYGYAAGIQGPGMAGPIYTNSKSAGYAEAGCCQMVSELTGSFAPGHAGVAGTNHCELRGVQYLRVTMYEEQRR